MRATDDAVLLKGKKEREAGHTERKNAVDEKKMKAS